MMLATHNGWATIEVHRPFRSVAVVDLRGGAHAEAAPLGRLAFAGVRLVESK
jgi:hypothetical protein